MSGEEGFNDAKTKLEKFLVLVDNYIDQANARFTSYQEEFGVVADLSMTDLGSKNQDELFNIAYTLYSYSSYIQDEVNKNQIVLNWCNSEIDRLLVTYDKNVGFDKYTKHETKKATLVVENSFATKIEQMRLHAESRLQALEGKVFNLKRQADTLLEKAKRK